LQSWRPMRRVAELGSFGGKCRVTFEPMNTERTIRNCERTFRKVCPRSWDDLESTDDNSVRHCSHCERNVFYCTTDAETINHAIAGHCIAREIPTTDELPMVFLGLPKNPPEITPEQIKAQEWYARENAIDDSLKNVDSSRACPKCNFPAPPWRTTCRICNFEFGRVPTAA
jgi:hypothetical protein